MAQAGGPNPDRQDVVAGLEMARKLVGLAREQRDALQRGSDAQFSWLVLRRQEVTDQLPRLILPGSDLPAEFRREIAALKAELGQLDGDMRSIINERLSRLRQARAALRRTERALAGYRQKRGPRAAFIDQKQ
ncbi:MAG: hypothetical protein KGJ86_03970 [Chloroflexota bacterium]|nr:hypothetical protein [Chloroflexota bacterium]